jgi:hypothetical protein
LARTWLSIRVDLVSGHGEDYWPRPGRIFAAARSHKFSQLADAMDTAFARWDRSHLYKFEMADGQLIGQVEFDDFDLGSRRRRRRQCPKLPVRRLQSLLRHTGERTWQSTLAAPRC